MSEYVHYKGKLKQYPMKIDLEETAKEIVEKEDWVYDADYYDNYLECLEEEGYEKYIVINGSIYIVIAREDVGDNDVFNAHNNNSDGTIDFEVSYYNGGCSFNEAIEEAISGMEK